MIALATTALILGLIGSLHCAGMCGPIVLSLPFAGFSKQILVWKSFVYHTGRVFTYAILGFITGWIGLAFELAGLGRWLSIGIGVTILLALVLSLNNKFYWQLPESLLGRFRSLMQSLLKKNNDSAVYGLGMLNGLLPCGLLYAALSGAAAAASPLDSALFMAIFGAGTFPMMALLTVTGVGIRAGLRKQFSKIYPVMLAGMAILLILRGLAVEIPGLHLHQCNKNGNNIECKK